MNKKLQVNLVALSFPKRDLSIPLLYLKGFAEKDTEVRERADLRVTQFERDADFEDIYRSLEGLDGGIFGFSCYVWNMEKCLALASRLKRERGAVVLFGGPQASALKLEMMRDNGFIDYLVVGEGERPFYNLLKRHFLDKEPVEGVRGVAWRREGEPVYNGDDAIAGDLSEVPLPHFHGDYRAYLDALDEPVTTQLETTRGCPFQCRYCSWYNRQKVRKFPLEEVFRAFAFLLAHPKISRIYVTDSNAFVFRERQKEILRFIISRNTRRIPVIFELNPEFLDDELVDLIALMGSQELAFGLQSTSGVVLGNINRRFRADLYREKIFRLKERFPGVKTWFGVILGLPGDTYGSFLDSLEFAVRLKPYSLYIHELLVLPGSEFYEKSAEYGLTFEKKPPYTVISNGTMSRDECRELKHLGFTVSLLHHIDPVREGMLEIYENFRHWRLIDLYRKFTGLLLERGLIPSVGEVSGMRSIEFDPRYEQMKGDGRFVASVRSALRDFMEELCREQEDRAWLKMQTAASAN